MYLGRGWDEDATRRLPKAYKLSEHVIKLQPFKFKTNCCYQPSNYSQEFIFKYLFTGKLGSSSLTTEFCKNENSQRATERALNTQNSFTFCKFNQGQDLMNKTVVEWRKTHFKRITLWGNNETLISCEDHKLTGLAMHSLLLTRFYSSFSKVRKQVYDKFK